MSDASGKVTFPGIPVSFILVIIVFCIFDVFLKKTALGRQIYCCGGNPEAARLSGIPSKNVLTFVYALSGFMAGMAGVVSVGRLASANGNAGTTYDNDAIAACILRCSAASILTAAWWWSANAWKNITFSRFG